MPARQEPAQSGLLGGLDLLPERGQRRAPQPAQDVGVAPLALDPSRAELAANQALLTLELPEHRLDVDPEVLVRLSRPERASAFREADDETLERVVAGFQEGLGQAAGWHRPQRVPVPPGVLGRDEPLLAGDANRDCSALLEQRLSERRVVLTGTQVTAKPEHVVQLVWVPRATAKLLLDLLECPRIDELAQLLLAEQLLEEIAVEREHLGPPLGPRRVVLVHVVRDVVEEQRARIRRGGGGFHVDEVELPRLQALEQLLQRGEVEDVLQALPVRLEDDRERAVLARDLEQALRLEPLLPERRPLAGPPARDQQRSARVLAEVRAEERGGRELAHHEVLDLRRVDDELLGGRRRVGVGQVDRDAVVGPERLDLEPE